MEARFRLAGDPVTAQAFAGQLAARPIPHLGDALKNALSESVFRLALEGADEQHVRDELCRLAHLTSAADRDEIARQRIELDRRKQELAEQQAEVARLRVENAMSVPQLKRFLQDMMDAPAFQPYFKAWTAMQAARDAAGPQEDLEPDDEPEPEDAAESIPPSPATARDCAEDAQGAVAPASNYPITRSLNYPITQLYPLPRACSTLSGVMGGTIHFPMALATAQTGK